jgi:hypothetical protein
VASLLARVPTSPLLKEKGENMQEHSQHPCDSLLQQWNLRREVANYYFTALMRLSPDAHNAVRRRQELSEKLFAARLSLKHAADQLQSCYQEHSSQELQWEGRG